MGGKRIRSDFPWAFGGVLCAKQSQLQDATTLGSGGPVKRWSLTLRLHSGAYAEPQTWQKALRKNITHASAAGEEPSADHLAYWSKMQQRSYIRTEGFAESNQLNQALLWQRYLNLCAGRGTWPIKFNGSLFTARWGYSEPERPEDFDPDYRRWGGGYWFQNSRLIYWTLLASRDHDLMEPLFRFYLDRLPFHRFRAKTYFGHEGAFLPEGQTLWGTYLVPCKP